MNSFQTIICLVMLEIANKKKIFIVSCFVEMHFKWNVLFVTVEQRYNGLS